MSVPAWAVAVAGAQAACAPAAPTNGQTVTCTDTTPSGFVAPAGVTSVTVNVQQGATVTGSQQTGAGANPGNSTVSINSTSTVNNAGTITNTAPLNRDNFGVNLSGSGVTLNNSGTISLSAPAGNTALRVYGAFTSVQNQPAGTLFDNLNIVNSGTISVTQNGNGIARGIYAGEDIGALTVSNTATGLISATRSTTATASTNAVAAIDSDDDVRAYTVNNAAGGRITAAGANTQAINGRASAFVINNGGTISNSDTIAGSAAIALYAAAVAQPYTSVINNTAAGVITGDIRNTDVNNQTAASIPVNRRSGTITNAGTINGSLFFGNGDQTINNTGRISGNVTFLDVATAGTVAGTVNTVNLGTGSSIGGAVTARGLGTNNLNLAGTGTLTSNVAGFTNLTQTAGAWTIGNNSTQAISGNLTVAGGALTLGAGTTQTVGGLIQVTGSGAQLTVNNTITDKAVNLSGSNTTLVNNGTLTGTGVAGRANSAATRVYGVLANSNTAAEFDNIRVVNNGTIAVTENGVGISRGIYAGENINSMFVTNTGTISATRNGAGTAAVAGIDSDDDVAALTVTNQAGARITGTGTGVRAIQGRAQNYTITNAGTISGPAGGDAISTFAAGGTRSYNTVLVNAATGVINGNVRNTDVDNQTASSTVVNRRSGSLTNAGTINGNLFFGGGNQTIGNTGRISGDLNFLDVATAGTVAGSVNRVTLGTGSSIGGNFVARGLGDNALTLTGNGTLTSNVSGFTTLSQADGAWTLATGSTQAFSGGAIVSGGVLTVNSTLNANTTVGPAGTLSGIGRIGGNLTNNGLVGAGTVTAPYGSLTVSGNYVQTASATLAANVNAAAQASRLAVTGSANLAGTATLVAAAGPYAPGTRYTLVTANGGVRGNFSAVTSSGLPTLLRATASTDANNAYATLTQQSFGLVAQSQNQRNAALGVDALLANNTSALTVLDNQSDQALAGILDRVAGQGYANIADPQLRAARAYTDAVMGRAYSALFEEGPTGFTLPPAVYAADLPRRTAPPEPRFIEATRGYGIWATGYGQVGSVNSTANTAGRDETIAGFAGGIDFHPSAGNVLGISAGYGSVDVSMNRTGERAHTDNAQVAVYGGIVNGPAYAIATAGYAHADGRLNRSLAGLQLLQPGGARGSIGGDQFLSSAEAGYRYAYTPGVTLAPFVGAQVSTFSQDRVSEGNGGLFNLNVAAKDFLSARTLVGGRLESTVDLGGRAVTVAVRAAYVHDFADVSRTIQSSFVLAPVVPFSVDGRRLNRDRALVGVGIGTQLAPGWTGFVNYDAELASSDTIQAGRAGVRYAF